jgi:hypothetical protein
MSAAMLDAAARGGAMLDADAAAGGGPMLDADAAGPVGAAAGGPAGRA